MSEKNNSRISYAFVPMGTTAPEILPPGEIWVDVGSRFSARVLDHHGGDIKAWSASELIKDFYKEMILEPLSEKAKIKIVTHQSPDLDAICAVWLMEKIIKNEAFPEPAFAFHKIIQAVSENDQGMVKAEQADACWPIVMRSLLDIEFISESDETKLLKGMKKLDDTLEIISSGGSLEQAAREIVTPLVQAYIWRAEQTYYEDLRRAIKFQLKLPIRRPEEELIPIPDSPQPSPSSKRDLWGLADALYIEDPVSIIFKELARGDRINSYFKRGFNLLIISYSLEKTNFERKYRYIISTDPFSGYHLKGLGDYLEKAEQIKEESLGLSLPPGRQRVNWGEGRFGYNVNSPWYDGRGHNFTIVDSPYAEGPSSKSPSSCLSPHELLNAIWEYGDPARFINISEAYLSIFRPVNLLKGWDNIWQECNSIDGLLQDLRDEVSHSITSLGIRRYFINRDFQISTSDGKSTLEPNKYELWKLPKEIGILIEHPLPGEKPASMRDFTNWVNLYLSNSNTDSTELLDSMRLSLNDDVNPFHLVHIRVDPLDITFNEQYNVYNAPIFIMASGEPPDFNHRPHPDQLSEASSYVSRDNKNMLMATPSGLAVISTRNMSLKQHPDFHHPDKLLIPVLLKLSQLILFRRLYSNFSIHRSLPNFMKASKQVIEDRLTLLQLEQTLIFQKITDKLFGQKCYEALENSFNLKKTIEDAKQKIELLASQIKDLRSYLMQMFAILISLIIAPIAIADAFFAGLVNARRIISDYDISFLSQFKPIGFTHFIFLVLIVTIFLGAIWMTVGWRRRIRKFFMYFQNKKAK